MQVIFDVQNFGHWLCYFVNMQRRSVMIFYRFICGSRNETNREKDNEEFKSESTRRMLDRKEGIECKKFCDEYLNGETTFIITSKEEDSISILAIFTGKFSEVGILDA